MTTCSNYRITENRTGMRVGTSETQRRIEIPGGTGHPITLGDKIMVRIEMPRGEWMSFSSCDLADMTEILGEVRRRTRGMSGLVKMCVRNASEGWRLERPLRLYPESFGPRGFGNVRRHEPAVASPRMLMPWETH